MEKSESNPQLQAAIIEVVENQLRNNDPLKRGKLSNVSLKPVILRKKQSD
jgi:hypothetical protein